MRNSSGVDRWVEFSAKMCLERLVAAGGKAAGRYRYMCRLVHEAAVNGRRLLGRGYVCRPVYEAVVTGLSFGPPSVLGKAADKLMLIIRLNKPPPLPPPTPRDT